MLAIPATQEAKEENLNLRPVPGKNTRPYLKNKLKQKKKKRKNA
jgi:hypothetical protein